MQTSLFLPSLHFLSFEDPSQTVKAMNCEPGQDNKGSLFCKPTKTQNKSFRALLSGAELKWTTLDNLVLFISYQISKDGFIYVLMDEFRLKAIESLKHSWRGKKEQAGVINSQNYHIDDQTYICLGRLSLKWYWWGVGPHILVFLRRETLHFVLKYLLLFFTTLNNQDKPLAHRPVFCSRNKRSDEFLCS